MKRWNSSVFIIKNYKKLRVISQALFLLMMIFISPIGKAHEMWIQPLNYSLKLGDKVFANEIVGQDFKGNKYAYLDSSYKSLNISIGDITRVVKSRLGDLPTIQEETLEEGLHVITAETTASELTYETSEKFANFLNADGLQWVFEAHKKRGLPEKGFTEVYRRSPKTLIKVGHGKGEDKVFGLPLEWVVETNPYTTDGNIRARLLWQGKPAINMYVNIFNKPKRTSPNSELIKTNLLTDFEGRIEIPRANGGLFLINSVKMIEPNEATALQTSAVWESIWGSLTYEILPNI